MRKIITMSFVTLLAVVLTCGLALAISGNCVNCHTMHNSQDGLAMTTGVGPFAQLLRADCIPCHTGPRDIVNYPSDKKNSFGAPIVFDTANPNGQGGGFTLAGGDFYWVANVSFGDTYGHNVVGVTSNVDANLGLTPPGFDINATPGILADGQINGGVGTWSTRLTCAGTNGCHGTHNQADQMAAVRGAHHGNTGSTSTQADGPTTIGGSYRFLGGINGLEKSDWNWVETAANHNEYFGVDSPNNRSLSNTTYPVSIKRTISYECAQCHGQFHAQIDNSSTGAAPWFRHPTDIVLPSDVTKEYQFYNPDNANQYSVEAPVARGGAVPSGSSATVTIGSAGSTGAIVMCLSCHRAHGSPVPDILRWTYLGPSGPQAGVGNTDSGCFTCHVNKNLDQGNN